MQFGAVCFRIFSKKKAKVLLITTRRSGKWAIPKGWPIDGQTPSQTALTEAFEEAGVIGQPIDFCLGHYSIRKSIEKDTMVPCIIGLYPVLVEDLAKNYPEKAERNRSWFTQRKAANRVIEPGLKRILLGFDPFTIRKYHLN